MTQAHLDRQHAPQEAEIRDWRFEQLQQAGYEPHQARLLSRRVEVDLHQAIDIVRRGCSPELAVLILL